MFGLGDFWNNSPPKHVITGTNFLKRHREDFLEEKLKIIEVSGTRWEEGGGTKGKRKKWAPDIIFKATSVMYKALFQELFSLAADGGNVVLNKLNVESTDLCYLM